MNVLNDERQFSALCMPLGSGQDIDLGKIRSRNKKRCAAFIAKMIEKYGREVLKEIEEGKISDVQPLQDGNEASPTN